MRQLLQNETESSYQKFIAKCDRGLLQCVSGITKCDRSLLQSASGITKCDSYYKVRRNTPISYCFWILINLSFAINATYTVKPGNHWTVFSLAQPR